MRARSSRTFRNTDGTFTTELFTAPIHYRDGGGWEEIDSHLVPSHATGFGWENAANSFSVRFRETAGPDFMEFEAAGAPVSVSLEGASTGSSQALRSSLRYERTFPGVDLWYDVIATGVKETLVLNDSHVPTRYRFRLASSGDLEAFESEDGSWQVSRGGTPLFVVGAPTVAESAAGMGPVTPSPAPSEPEPVASEPVPTPEDTPTEAEPSPVPSTTAETPTPEQPPLETPSPEATETIEPSESPTDEPSQDEPTFKSELREFNALQTSAGAPSQKPVELEVDEVGDDLVLDLMLDPRWLHAPDRQFPVLLDPTMTVDHVVQDATWRGGLPDVTGQRLNLAEIFGSIWKSAVQFDVGDIPRGVDVSSASLRLWHDATCPDRNCDNNLGLSAHRIMSYWDATTTEGNVSYDSTALSEFTLVKNAAPQWLTWDTTQLLRDWISGEKANFGLFVRRTTSSSAGTTVPSSRYSGDPDVRPHLQVTYTPGVNLRRPSLVHSNGAELDWDAFDGGSSTFDHYEVHRSKTPHFEPSPSTLLASIPDESTTDFVDTTAAPNATFYYKIVANSAKSNEQQVVTPADGRAVRTLVPDSEGKTSYIRKDPANPSSCDNHGAETGLRVGVSKAGEIFRSLVAFDLQGIPSQAQVYDARLRLFRAKSAGSDLSIAMHALDAAWDEGTGLGSCTNDGATWTKRTPTDAWTVAGGQFDSTAVGSVPLTLGQADGWDAWSVTSLVAQWLSGARANHGVLVKTQVEAGGDERYPKEISYFADDWSLVPALRPTLEVTFEDGSHAQAPSVVVTGPSAGTTVSGHEVVLSASASDDGRVAEVEFLVDDQSVGQVSDGEALLWDSTDTPDGSHTLTARAIDDAGNQTTSTGVAITVDNGALPTVQVTQPDWTDYRQAVLADSPRGYWGLGDDGSTVLDLSGNQISGTHAQTSDVDDVAIPKVAGTGTRFAGNDASTVTIPDNDLLDVGTGNFTIEAWMRSATPDTSTKRELIRKGYSGPNENGHTPYGWILRADDATGKLKLDVRANGSSKTIDGPATNVLDGRWHHIAVAFDRSTGTRFYVDGVEFINANLLSGDVSNTMPIHMGAFGPDNNLSSPFSGDLDEVAFYASALSAQRIQAHLGAGLRTVKGIVPIAATAGDDEAVDHVEFHIDGIEIGRDDTAPYSMDWDTLNTVLPFYDGVYTLTATAFDSGGRFRTSRSVPLRVGNADGTPYEASIVTTEVPQLVMDQPGANSTAFGLDVTVTNESSTKLNSGDATLDYRWIAPDGTEQPVAGTVPLGTSLDPGKSTTVRMTATAPELPIGDERSDYTLQVDLVNTATNTRFSKKGSKPARSQPTIEKAKPTPTPTPTASASPTQASAPIGLGVERYFHYDSEPVGAGMTSLVNVASGNSILQWTPFTSPGRGLSTVVGLTYNGLEERSDTFVGGNWSLAVSGLTRFGNPLQIHPNNPQGKGGVPTKTIDFIDGDGTLHTFQGKTAADGKDYWEEPAGIHLWLRSTEAADCVWALTRPDDVTFCYDSDGFPTHVKDRNGNRLTFETELVPAEEVPGEMRQGEDTAAVRRRVVSVTDAGQRSFDIDYYSHAETKTNNAARGKVQSISDHDGSKLEFYYYADGNLKKLVQLGGGGSDGSTIAARQFIFTYTNSNGSGPAISDANKRKNPPDKVSNQSSRVFSVIDPRGNETTFSYFSSGQDKWRLQSRTNRESRTTTFAYDNAATLTTVTSPMSRTTKYDYGTDGSVTKVTDPLQQDTLIAWTSDRHVAKVTEPTGKYTEFAYNANGYVTDQWDQLRNHTTLTYDNRAVSDSSGRDSSSYWKTGRTIPHLSRLTKVTDPRNNFTTITYDTRGNPDLVSDPENFKTDYNFNTDGTLAQVKDANDGVVRFTSYDANGFPQVIEDQIGRKSRFSYDPDGLLRWVKDPLHFAAADTIANRTELAYDAFHRLTLQSSPKSSTELIYTEIAYDPNDNVVSQRNPALSRGSGALTTFTYDKVDALKTSDAPSDTSDPSVDEKTTIDYDNAGRVSKITRPKGLNTASTHDFSTVFEYDVLDRVIREIARNSDASRTETTHYCYDLAGDLVSETAPRAALASVECATSAAYTTRYTYDDAHRLKTVTDPMNRVRKLDYDENSNVKSTTNENNDTTTFTYDKRNLLIQKVEPFKTVAPTRSVTTQYRYDAVGNLQKLISPRAFDLANGATPVDYVTEYVYDKANQLTKVKLPNRGSAARNYVHSSYDANGNLKWTTLPTPIETVTDQANGITGITTKMEFFDNGWIKSVDDPANPKVDYDYTPEGWQSFRKAGAASAETWTYNPDGTLSEFKDRLVAPTTYRYDANSNLKKIIDSSGRPAGTEKHWDIRLSYDDFDRLAEVAQAPVDDPTTDPNGLLYTTYGYDLNGNLQSRVDDGTKDANGVVSGRRHTFDYDSSDRLIRHEGFLKPGCDDNFKVEYDYEPVGWEKDRKLFRSGTGCSDESPVWGTAHQQTLWTYFANGKLKTLVTKDKNGVAKESHTIDYIDNSEGPSTGVYVNGHRTKDDYFLNPGSGKDCSSNSTLCDARYVYDAMDRVTKHDNGATVTDYVLDPAGNITKETIDGNSAGAKTFTYDGTQLKTVTQGSATSKYFYNPEGQLDCVTKASASACPTSGTNDLLTDYVYDALGRIKTFKAYDGSGALQKETSYTHDVLDRLEKEVESPAGQSSRTTTFTYQGITALVVEDLQVKSGTPDVKRAYDYDAFGTRVAMTKTGGADTGFHSYAYDVMGSTSLLFKGDGSVKASYGYTAYGANDPKISAGDTNADDPFNAYRYGGFRFDPGSGEIDMGARRFSTETSRFTTPDFYMGALDNLGLSTDALTGNRYALASGNPVSYVEWDGHVPVDADGGTNQEAVVEMNRARGVAPPPGTVGSGSSAEFASGDARSTRRVHRAERRTLAGIWGPQQVFSRPSNIVEELIWGDEYACEQGSRASCGLAVFGILPLGRAAGWAGKVLAKFGDDIALLARRAPILRRLLGGADEAVSFVDRANSLLAPGGSWLGRAGSPGIREVQGDASAARKLFEQLSTGGDVVRSAPGHTLVQLGDDAYVGFRTTSKSGPPTIDVNIPGVEIEKIKFLGG